MRDVQEPIRAELFSIERLEQHAESLAAAQTVTDRPKKRHRLTRRVLENGRVLLQCYRTLVEAVQQEHTITPAAEWLVDNFHIVDEQIREIRDDLPPGYYRKLPKLASGPFEGLPRVFGVAWAFVAHTDSRFDLETLRRFVNAYQRVQPLSIGELWALMITLRIVLVENLRRLSEKIVHGRAARQEADALADKLIGARGAAPVRPENALTEIGPGPLEEAFAVHLLQRLRDLSPNVRPVLLWLDQRLSEQGTTADDVVRSEHQRQASMNVTVRNIITSMRLMSSLDWNEFFESVSLVDTILSKGTNFAGVTFATRDSYRHSIEDLARHSPHTETEIAQMVAKRIESVRLESTDGHAPDDVRTDPGFYLVSRGRFEFEREVGFRPSWARRILRFYVRHAALAYLGTIALITAVILAFPLAHIAARGVGAGFLVLLGLVASVPASDLAIALVNRFVTDLLGPWGIPRLELKEGVPEHLRTIVVVPTLLGKRADVEELIGHLEVHYLSNPEGCLHYALLSDWTDADQETLPGDQELLSEAINGIARLNQLYGPSPGGGLRFLLFHRKRVWNPSEGKWMGWERKRGKLHELNRFLRGSEQTSFLQLDPLVLRRPEGVRYVVTLDSDTRLPRGAAYNLIGTIAHPLNRPQFSEAAGRVTQGYGVVQPRITPTLPIEHRGSIFQRIFSGPAGIDPYASAISDVYQDLFHEGSYTGKGIYDLDAFENTLTDKVPENVLLSHDLFEGTFARTALVTDIELFEEYPAQYSVAAARQHRWARGDWQLLPWIFGRGPTVNNKFYRSHVPIVGRWKMFDNLRRSLSAPAMFLTLLLGWLIPPAAPGVWTRFILATIAIPALLPFLMGLNPRRGVSARTYFRALRSDLVTGVIQIALTLTFLAYQAWLMSDGIVRTLFRMVVTRKHLLEWITAAQAKRMVDLRLRAIYVRMIGGVALAIIAGVFLMFGRHGALADGAPFLVLWLAAPAIARWISLPPAVPKSERVSLEERKALRLIARQTWRFFETFVTEEDNYLPPDNFQEDPKPAIAHRTSPTNIGLCMLSTLAAHDFGWIGISETAERIDGTLRSIERLEKFRGHCYNWYNTRTLQPLEPKYVSSVDSGNLAGHLVAVANGLLDLEDSVVGENLFAGLRDNLEILREALASVSEARPTHTVTRKQISDATDDIAAMLQRQPNGVAELSGCLMELRSRARALADIVQAFSHERAEAADSELQIYADAVLHCVESHFRDAEILIPGFGSDANAAVQSRSVAFQTSAPQSGPQRRPSIPSLGSSARFFEAAVAEARSASEPSQPTADSSVAVTSAVSTASQLKQAADAASALAQRVSELVRTAESNFRSMDFSFLFDRSRKLFSIGFRATEGILDASCYDLLASEARLTSFVAIAKGDAETSHWFRLGRSFTPVGGGSALISWSGSMFEYLMPALVMRSPAGSVLHSTNELVVRRQIEYGAERHVPWGVSESAFNARDLDLSYQYSGFGVPGLGLKRGLSEDLVIAPYATALAAMVDGPAAAGNFVLLEQAGGKGPYGFYEALDYTKTRVPEGQQDAVVHTYMAHHQGMSLVSLANVLHDDVMQNRFHAEPMMQATELLLQERAPRDVLVSRPRAEEVTTAAVRDLVPPVVRTFTLPHEPMPRTQLLSNGKYSVMLTEAGSGYSRWGDIAVTRWREDSTRDAYGFYIYLRDTESNEVWSAGYQPCAVEPDLYEACFYEDRATITRRDRSLTSALEVVVSSEDDAEMRRVSITNIGARAREIQVTSYAEICLTTQAADVAHPAFSNLFVQTEFDRRLGALVATRRRQSAQQPSVWLAHVAAVEGEESPQIEYETDRAKFIGRGRTGRGPVCIVDGPSLSNSAGPVLDPIISLRRTVRIPPGKMARIVFATAMGASREEVLKLADKYRNAKVFERILTMAWTQAQVQLRHLNIAPDEANLFQQLANLVLYSDASLRPAADVLSRAQIDVKQIWAHGISGDLPIVLALIDQSEDIGVIRQLLRAHEYWRIKQVAVDLVIIDEEPISYEQELHTSLLGLVRASQQSTSANPAQGGVFLLRADLVQPQVRAILESMARAVVVGRRGALSEQITRVTQLPDKISRPRPVPQLQVSRKRAAQVSSADKLEFFNGLGGFADNAREYVVALGEGLRTPQPWINVIANPSFGFLVSESGSGYTWSLNSREHEITPWSNDPVTDPPGEVLYIRDDMEGDVWTPTALPIRDHGGSYIARHGQGYTILEHFSHGIRHELLQFVPVADSIKISRLTLQNQSGRLRRLSVTAYAEWVLGSSRSASAPFIITQIDSQTGALFARSMYGSEFAARIAFADLAGRQDSITADRKEFLGRHGSLDSPAALERGAPLSGRAGAALDPCAALQTSVELRPGARAEILFFLGDAANKDEARRLITAYRAADLDRVLAEVFSRWDNVLNGVEVSTPDRAMNLLLNRWLLYQTLSCRAWGRTAFYQASGAFGFRDQLQDIMALCVAERGVAREHLCLAAGRQFPEGDVQHWWHPPSGRGIRTRISDDRLWLPYAVGHFIDRTGDRTILDEQVPFLQSEPIPEGQTDSYFDPRVTKETATVFEHCARALDSSLTVGSHGLPLMGTGDWNDGMNRVGAEGKGESVWLAWFLHTVLSRFALIAADRGERERAQNWRLHLSALKAALEREAWDGEWYRRAFFDDGSPLGSAANQECRIDSIAQSWGVISRAAEPGRAVQAMNSVYANLVRSRDNLVLLFAPPFGQAQTPDGDAHDPGYIKGYLPGARENGGQYTHAAVWNILAFAMLGDGRRALELFRILNPITHASSRAGLQRYKVEPYVVAGDVYAEPPHIGRGGWTWYTGSSGWLYRVAVETILGFQMRGMSFRVDPCISPDWPGFSLIFRYHSAVYRIRVENPSCVTRGVALTRIDGALHAGVADVPLANDGREHEVLVVLG